MGLADLFSENNRGITIFVLSMIVIILFSAMFVVYSHAQRSYIEESQNLDIATKAIDKLNQDMLEQQTAYNEVVTELNSFKETMQKAYNVTDLSLVHSLSNKDREDYMMMVTELRTIAKGDKVSLGSIEREFVKIQNEIMRRNIFKEDMVMLLKNLENAHIDALKLWAANNKIPFGSLPQDEPKKPSEPKSDEV
jgi:hypothetical protein